MRALEKQKGHQKSIEILRKLFASSKTVAESFETILLRSKEAGSALNRLHNIFNAINDISKNNSLQFDSGRNIH